MRRLLIVWFWVLFLLLSTFREFTDLPIALTTAHFNGIFILSLYNINYNHERIRSAQDKKEFITIEMPLAHSRLKLKVKKQIPLSINPIYVFKPALFLK